MISMEKIRIILPTYNEKENLKVLLPELFRVFSKHKLNADVLVIDDNSQDGTVDFIEKMEQKHPVKLIKRDGKIGIGSAYIRGFKESLNDGKEIIFEMDADLSHSPEYIVQFIKKIDEGFDLVIGERKKIVGWNFYRKMISFGGNFIGRNLAGIKIKDLTTGYRAYRSNLLDSISLDKIESNGYAFQLETLFRSLSNGFKVGSVPIVFYDRQKGKSKLSKRDMIEFFVLALKIRLGLIDV